MSEDNYIKVIIVDDSYLVRVDIKSAIDWHAIGFEIVGEASNGRQGIELYEQTHCDVIITDIRMPVMNGLEMVDEIFTRGLSPEFILLSAYEDFDYARKAINLNVVNYILKHEIYEEVFKNTLLKTKAQVLARKNRRKSEINVKCRDYLIKRTNTDYKAIVFEPQGAAEGDEYSFIVTHYENDIKDSAKIIEGAVHKVCDECSDTLNILCAFDAGQRYVVCAAKKQDGNIINHCSGFARRVQSHIPQNTIILSILIGKQESSPEKFLDAYISAIAASDCDVFLQEDDCIFYSWEYAPQQYDNDAVNKLLSQAEEAIQLGEISQAQILIDKIRKICSVYKNVGCFMQAKRNIDGALRKYLGEDVPEGTGIKKAKQYFDGVSALIAEFSHNADVSLKTREALKYLHKNLDCDISLEDIARVMQVSPVYAGQLFKKDMGVSFNKYLASARIEKSKVLLKSGKYKIYEISAMVGYSTVQYFSSIFKKATGVSPSDYC